MSNEAKVNFHENVATSTILDPNTSSTFEDVKIKYSKLKFQIY
jgi:hypothetical protein